MENTRVSELAKELGFAVNYYCEFSPEKKYQLLLGFSVLNEKGEVVEVEEEPAEKTTEE